MKKHLFIATLFLSGLFGMQEEAENPHAQLTHLNLSHNEFTNIQFIVQFSNVRSLTLKGCHTLENNYYPVQYLTKLEELNLNKVLFSDLTPLIPLKCLKKLSMQQSMVTTIRPLLELTQLKHLDVSSSRNITDIHLIGLMLNLTRLKMEVIFTEDMRSYTTLQFSGSIRALKRLDVSYNLYDDVSCIKNIPNLQVLSLRGCYDIKSYDFLLECPKLEKIYINNDQPPKHIKDALGDKLILKSPHSN